MSWMLLVNVNFKKWHYGNQRLSNPIMMNIKCTLCSSFQLKDTVSMANAQRWTDSVNIFGDTAAYRPINNATTNSIQKVPSTVIAAKTQMETTKNAN